LLHAQLVCGGAGDLLSGMFWFLVVSAAVTLVPTVLFGLPYLLWLRSRGTLTALRICAGAAAIGAGYLALLSWGTTWANPAPSVFTYVVGACLGLIGGLAFCLGARPNISFQR